VGETTSVIHLTDDPSAAAAAVVGDSIVGSIRRNVERLVELAAPSERRSLAKPRATLAATMDLTTAGVFAAIRGTLPGDAVIVEETPSLHTRLHDIGLLRPGRYFSAASGSLGFGLPAAAGAAFAAPGKRILAVIGDGSAHYGIQGIWTAVEHHLPVTFLIVNNAGYDAMNAFSKLMKADRSPSFAIRNVDFASLAAGYGCRAETVTTEADLAAALGRSYALSGPSLIDARTASATAALF
jgi:benzoylformate decarboxylase